MPSFYVQFTRFAARSISVSGNATDAIEAVRKEFEAPIYCRIHNGMPPDQCFTAKINNSHRNGKEFLIRFDRDHLRRWGVTTGSSPILRWLFRRTSGQLISSGLSFRNSARRTI